MLKEWIFRGRDGVAYDYFTGLDFYLVFIGNLRFELSPNSIRMLRDVCI